MEHENLALGIITRIQSKFYQNFEREKAAEEGRSGEFWIKFDILIMSSGKPICANIKDIDLPQQSPRMSFPNITKLEELKIIQCVYAIERFKLLFSEFFLYFGVRAPISFYICFIYLHVVQRIRRLCIIIAVVDHGYGYQNQ